MNKKLIKDIKELSRGYDSVIIDKDEDGEFILIKGFKLPPGYNRNKIDVLLYPPKDYPLSPPGLEHSLFVPKDLRYKGAKIEDFHPKSASNWAWLCFQRIRWNPNKDNLITFFEMVRANLTFIEAASIPQIKKIGSHGCLSTIVMALIGFMGLLILVALVA